jgi:uncharacterized membrane protein YjdF
VAFATLTYVGWIAFGLSTGRRAVLAYALMMPAIAGFVLLVHHRVQLSGSVLWALGLWAFLHMAGGLVPIGDGVLYNAPWDPIPWLRYDRIVHTFGFGTATIACGQALARSTERGQPVPAFHAFLAGMGLGAVNEVVEFVSTRLFETNVGGYANTGWDLVANTIGCAAATAFLTLRSRADEPRGAPTSSRRAARSR